jgi:hypothetical protein
MLHEQKAGPWAWCEGMLITDSRHVGDADKAALD